MVKQKTYHLVTWAALILVVLLIAAAFVWDRGLAPDTSNAAKTTVERFGSQMQKVSLLSPDASSTIASTYGSLATEDAIHEWQKDPRHAPGKLTSSPWPDHINVTNVSKQGSGYVVSGDLVMETSAGEAGSVPVVVQVVPSGSAWLVAAYQEQATSTSKKK